MQYLLAIYSEEKAAESMPREQMTEVVNAYMGYTKEQLGGYYLIDVSDLDAALSWAARCPAARYGTVEVRPIWVM